MGEKVQGRVSDRAWVAREEEDVVRVGRKERNFKYRYTLHTYVGTHP